MHEEEVMLQTGQNEVVTLPLKPRDFAWCEVIAKGWRIDVGNYEIAGGDSSRNLT